VALEVGWYLRFARSDKIEALVQDRAVDQIRAHLAPDMGWDMAVEQRQGHSLVHLTRSA